MKGENKNSEETKQHCNKKYTYVVPRCKNIKIPKWVSIQSAEK